MRYVRTVRTAKKAQNIMEVNFLMLFKEIIPIYSDNQTKPLSTK
jgi:hypothetical protein